MIIIVTNISFGSFMKIAQQSAVEPPEEFFQEKHDKK